MVRGAIIGMSLSGKTTLAKHLSRSYWTRHKIRSFVLDPNNERYGAHALVMQDENKFWEIVWKTRGSLVIVDEAAETIARNDDLTPVFTRLRHLDHKLLVVAHRATNLTPIMREQVDTVYLFRQSEKNCEIFAEIMAEPELLKATGLPKYHYIYCALYEKPKVCSVTPFSEK